MADSASSSLPDVEYRRHESVNGKIVVIEEHRRRRRMNLSFHGDAPAHSPSKGDPGLDELPCLTPYDPKRVASRSAPKPVPRYPVIVRRGETPLSSRDKLNSNNFSTSSIPEIERQELTPPPTPRINRLPTPDLSDLDHLAFCDCCHAPDRKLLCSNCGREAKPPKNHWVRERLSGCEALSSGQADNKRSNGMFPGSTSRR